MKSIMAALAAVAVSLPATVWAAGPTPPAQEPVIVAPIAVAPARSWAGGYVGGGLSYSRMTVEDLTFGPGPFHPSGGQVHAFAGMNFQSGSFVFGPEITVSFGDVDGDDGAFMRPFEMQHTIGLRGRVGYDAGSALPYLAVGVVQSRFEADHAGNGVAADFADTNARGWTAAIGVDWRIGDRMFLRGEIQRINYRNRDLPFYNNTDPHEIKARENRVMLGIGLQF